MAISMKSKIVRSSDPVAEPVDVNFIDISEKWPYYRVRNRYKCKEDALCRRQR